MGTAAAGRPPAISTPNGSASTFGQTISISGSIKSAAALMLPFVGAATVVDQYGYVLGTAAVGSSGIIKFLLTGVTAGNHICVIAYAGDANHAAATSSKFTLQVSPAATTAMLKTTSSQFVYGQSVSLTATVTSTGAPQAARTGNVTFKDGTTIIGRAALNGNSTATLTVPIKRLVRRGAPNYCTSYSGNIDFKGSSSSSVVVAVKKSRACG